MKKVFTFTFKKNLPFLILSSLTLISFQNCSQGSFSTPYSDVSRNPSSLSDTGGSTNVKTCSLNSSVYQPGQSVSGYALSSAVSPTLCGAQVTRTCLSSGLFNGSVPLFSSCQQQCLHPDNSQPVNSGSTYIYFTKASGTSQADCDSAKITTTCSASTGLFDKTLPATRYTACKVAGQTCAYTTASGYATPSGYNAGATVSGFVAQSATYPTLCGAQVTRTCQSSGNWSDSVPVYTSCVQKCVHPDSKQPVDQNSTYVYYTLQSGTQAQCDAAKVTSTCSASTGLFSGTLPTTRYTSCSVLAAPTISSFASNLNSITTGSSATLSWTTMNATSIKLDTTDVTGTSQKVVSPAATTTYTLTATNAQGSVTAKVTITVTAAPAVLLGQALYDNSCAGCHNPYATSNLKGRIVTADKITSATTTISAMASLKGVLTAAQLTSLETLFNATSTPTNPTTSSFACANTEAEKNNSLGLTRLTGVELQNTYKNVLSTTVWTALANSVYLLPVDKFEGNIANFKNLYTEDVTEQISRFNEQVANQIVSNNTNIQAFFGTCASTTSFAKTCFDSFLNSKGALLLRSALAIDDNTTIWNSVQQATSATDQMKIAIQVIFNDPRFLYHVEVGEGNADANGLYSLTSYEIANRIAYGMTSAPPDSMLWAAAVANSLKSTAAIATQVDRIAQTTAFQNRVVDFMKFYIGKSSAGNVITNSEFLNGINSTNLDVAVTDEFNEFIKYIVFTKKGNITDLYTSNAAFPKTTALASILGTSVWSSGAPMTAPNHAGLVARPYFVFANNPNLKLVQRGRALRMYMLCSDVPQPSDADLAARPVMTENDLITLNRRQYMEKATMSAPSCIACHSKMNQLGYTTENYDSIGRYQTTERIYNTSDVKVATFPVTTTSQPSIVETDTRIFNGLNEFEVAFSQADTMHQCFTRKSFQFFLRKEESISYDSCRLNKMDNQIKQGQPLLNFFIESFKQPSMLYKRSN